MRFIKPVDGIKSFGKQAIWVESRDESEVDQLVICPMSIINSDLLAKALMDAVGRLASEIRAFWKQMLFRW
jgi:hypothetical protein